MKSLLLLASFIISTAAQSQSVELSCRNSKGDSIRLTSRSLIQESLYPKDQDDLVFRMRDLFYNELENVQDLKISKVRLEVAREDLDCSQSEPGLLNCRAVALAGGMLQVEVEIKKPMGRTVVLKFESGIPLKKFAVWTGPAAGPITIGNGPTTVKLDKTYARSQAQTIILYGPSDVRFDQLFGKEDCR